MSNIQFATYDGINSGSTSSMTNDGYHAAYINGAYAAVGAFTGTVGLPAEGQPINDLASFETYVDDLLAKSTEITSDPLNVRFVNATGAYAFVGGTNGDRVSAYAADGNSGDGLLYGRDGDDAFIAGSGDDTIAPGSGNDSLTGGDGVDTLSFSDVTAFADQTTGVQVDFNDAGSGSSVSDGIGSLQFDHVENLIGSSQADTLKGDGNANLIDGGNGADTIALSGGADTLDGGAGVDILDASASAAGVTLNLSLSGPQPTSFFQLQSVGRGGLTIENIEGIVGSTFDDMLTGDAGANSIQGGGGEDIIYGGGGDDIINNLLSHGAAFGQAGSDTLLTNGQGDYLDGGAGADRYEFHGLIAARSATLGEIGNGDTVSLDFATAYGADQFTAVEHFDREMACEVIAKYHAGPDRTVYKFDLDGDGHQDHKIVAKDGHYDYSQFTGVDTSHLTTSAAHDHGGLVT